MYSFRTLVILILHQSVKYTWMQQSISDGAQTEIQFYEKEITKQI